MTDLTPEALDRLEAKHGEIPSLRVGVTMCRCGRDWPCETGALVAMARRTLRYEKALREITLMGALGPDSRLAEHFDYTTAPDMHAEARAALAPADGGKLSDLDSPDKLLAAARQEKPDAD